MPTCTVCPRHCVLQEGQTGACRARMAYGDEVVCTNYGRITSLALDPIEKKPLARYYAGSMILSVGSYGCNLYCPFCQNHEISQQDHSDTCRLLTADEIVEMAVRQKENGNIGIAFTYNEPSVGWEFVRDVSILAKQEGLKTAMVTNGCFSQEVAQELLPWLDALNIDLKCFSKMGYKLLGGDLDTVRANIQRAAYSGAHVEVTTLVVPGFSDDQEEMRQEAAWLASVSPDITLHLSRYFPCWQAKQPSTSKEALYALADIAQEHLESVYLGNI